MLLANPQAIEDGSNDLLFKYDADDPRFSDPAALGLSIVAPANRYAFDVNGIAQSYAANTFRKDAYVRTTTGLWVKSWLVEGLGCTNLLASSCDVTNNLYWGGFADFNITDVASCIAGQVAKRLNNKGLVVSRSVVQNAGTFTAGVNDVAWAIVENVDADVTVLGIRDTSTPGWVGLVSFDWATKAMTVTAGSGVVYGAIELPNGRWILWLTAAGITTGTNRAVLIYPTGTTQNTKTSIIHHVQLEPARVRPSSIIVTTTAGLSRLAENITAPWGHRLQPMTLYVKGVDAGLGVSTSTPRLLQIDWGSNTAPRVLLYSTATAVSLFGLDSGGSLRTSSLASGMAYGQAFEQRGYFDATGSARVGLTLDAGVETLGPPSGGGAIDTTPALTELLVGFSGGMFAARRLIIARGADRSRAYCRGV